MNIKKDRTWLWILFGLGIVVATFGGLGAWSAMTRIVGAVVASGSVEVEGQIKTVQHLYGGIVGRILVREGDRVEAGALLVRLDDTDAQADLGVVNGRLDEFEARLARLKAERDSLETVEFPPEFAAREAAGDAAVLDVLRGQRSLFKARRDNLNGQIGLLRQQTEQLRSKQQAAETRLLHKQQQADIQLRTIERKAEAGKGVVSLDARDRLDNEQVQLKGDIEGQRAEAAAIGIAISENELKVLQLDKENRETILAEIADVQAKVAELREQKRSLEKKLQLIEIVAPIAGRVLNMSVTTLGGVIGPGTTVLQIVPETDDFVVRARVRTVDVDQVAKGKPAKVHLTAFDPRTTPGLDGSVKSISAAEKIDEATRQPYFLVDVEIPKAQLDRLGTGPRLIPGMPVEVYIQTVERTPLEYMLQPLLVWMRPIFKEPV